MSERLTAEQCRAARALLHMTQDQLAAASGLSARIVQNVEQSTGALGVRRRAVARCLTAAFDRAGVEFIDSQGVRLREGQK